MGFKMLVFFLMTTGLVKRKYWVLSLFGLHDTAYKIESCIKTSWFGSKFLLIYNCNIITWLFLFFIINAHLFPIKTLFKELKEKIEKNTWIIIELLFFSFKQLCFLETPKLINDKYFVIQIQQLLTSIAMPFLEWTHLK